MRSDFLSPGVLETDYKRPWDEVYKQVVMLLLPGIANVTTFQDKPWKEMAVIEGKVQVLGEVISTTDFVSCEQRLNIQSKSTVTEMEKAASWSYDVMVHAPTKGVRPGDLLCFVVGAGPRSQNP